MAVFGLNRILIVLEQKLGEKSRPSSVCLVVVASLGHPLCFYTMAGNFHKKFSNWLKQKSSHFARWIIHAPL